MKSLLRLSFLLLISQFTVIQVNAAEELTYTVRPGDNLWNLATTHCLGTGYYRKLQQHNAVRDPLRLIPGTRLKIPIAWLKHTPTEAEVVGVKGAVELSSGSDSKTKAARAGDRLTVGDRIKVGVDGSITVRFADGSQLNIKPGTELVMDALSAYGDGSMIDTRLRMQHGRIDAEVRSNKDTSSHYEITTPAAASIVRGTSFRVSAENDKPLSRTEVLQGTVGVTGAATTRTVPAEYGTVTEAGKPPIEPRPLLPAPDINHWPKELRLWPQILAWSPVDGAKAYRMQVAEASDKALLLIDEKLVVTRFELPMLADGRYIVQLRAIDELGLEGLNADHSLHIAVRQFVPALLKLAADGRVRQSELLFQWQAVEGRQQYLIQIAKDPQFSQLIQEQKLATTQFIPEPQLPAGTYYWRVASFKDSDTIGPLSPAHQIQVLPLLPAPVIGLAERGDEGIRFQWEEVADSSGFQFQLSSEADFSTITNELETTETEVVLPTLPAGTYYYRVKAIDSDGYSSPYSEAGQYIHASGFYWPLLFILFFPLVL